MVPDTVKRRSLSQQIIPILRDEIRTEFKPGDRLCTIAAFARRFEVSFHSVREALSVLEQEGLIERHAGRGTFVCDGQKGRHVGVLVEIDLAAPHTSYYYRRAAGQTVELLRAAGVDARLYTGHASQTQPRPLDITSTEFRAALALNVFSGVIAFAAPEHRFPLWFQDLRRAGIPIVSGGGKIGEEVDAVVRPDLNQMIRSGVGYLLAHGRRRIALMAWRSRWEPAGHQVEEFIDTFRAAMAEAGLPVYDRWVRDDLPPVAPGAGWEEFREIWMAGDAHGEKPDGMLIADDNLFLGAAMAVLQLGIRVPEDLLIVSHHNQGSGLASPLPVTRLEFNPDAFAQARVDLLLKLMRRQPLPSRDILISHTLVEVESGCNRRSQESADKRQAPEHNDGSIRSAAAPAGIG